jgi:putative tryptophan/tyrosine transport system substrate-binding protein
MRRRDFINVLGGAVVAWPLGGLAQPAGKLPRVGVLWHAGSAEEEAIYLGALLEGFKELGYVDGTLVKKCLPIIRRPVNFL